jgi:hypothetical protein
MSAAAMVTILGALTMAAEIALRHARCAAQAFVQVRLCCEGDGPKADPVACRRHDHGRVHARSFRAGLNDAGRDGAGIHDGHGRDHACGAAGLDGAACSANQ